MEFGATHTAASLDEALPRRAATSRGGAMADKVIMTMGVGDGECSATAPGLAAQARPRRRHQHPPGRGDDGQRQPARPDADGEAGRRLAVRLGQPALRHPEAARASTARASSTSTASSPRPTRSTTSTRATRTCATARTSAASWSTAEPSAPRDGRLGGRTAWPPPTPSVRRPTSEERRGVHVKTRAAVFWGVGQDWKVEEIDLDPPKAGEVLVEMKAAGLCHSDEHLVTGDMVDAPTRSWRGRRAAAVLPDHRRARGRRHRARGRPRRHQRQGRATTSSAVVRAVVRPLPLLLDRPPEPVRPRRRRASTAARSPTAPSRHHCPVARTLDTMWPSSARSAEHTVVAEASVIKVDDDLPLDGRLPGVVRRGHRLGLGRRAGPARSRATPWSWSASAASA